MTASGLIYILLGCSAICGTMNLVSTDASQSRYQITRFTRSTSSQNMRTYSKLFSRRRSNVDCALQCSKDPTCLAFYFNRPQSQCILASTDQTLEDTLIYTSWLFHRIQVDSSKEAGNTETLVTDINNVKVTKDTENVFETISDITNNAHRTTDKSSNIIQTTTHGNSNVQTTIDTGTNSNVEDTIDINNNVQTGFPDIYNEMNSSDNNKISTETYYATSDTLDDVITLGHIQANLSDVTNRSTGEKNNTDIPKDDQILDSEVWYGYRQNGCYHDYVPSLNKCVSFRTEMTSSVTWAEASNLCHQSNGNLIDFSSSDEFLVFRKIILANFTLSRLNWHIGLQYHNDRAWRWINAGVVVPFGDALWAKNKPSLGVNTQGGGSYTPKPSIPQPGTRPRWPGNETFRQRNWLPQPGNWSPWSGSGSSLRRSLSSSSDGGSSSSGNWAPWSGSGPSNSENRYSSSGSEQSYSGHASLQPSNSGSVPFESSSEPSNSGRVPPKSSNEPSYAGSSPSSSGGEPSLSISGPSVNQPSSQWGSQSGTGSWSPGTYCGCITVADEFLVSDDNCWSSTKRNYICQY